MPMFVFIIWWVYAIVVIILAVLAYVLTPSAKQPKSKEEKIDRPVTKEGKTIGLVYGTELIREPNVVNYWGLRVVDKVIKGSSKK